MEKLPKPQDPNLLVGFESSDDAAIDRLTDHYANNFCLTVAGQRNRNHVGERVDFAQVPFAMEEILFDP